MVIMNIMIFIYGISSEGGFYGDQDTSILSGCGKRRKHD